MRIGLWKLRKASFMRRPVLGKRWHVHTSVRLSVAMHLHPLVCTYPCQPKNPGTLSIQPFKLRGSDHQPHITMPLS